MNGVDKQWGELENALDDLLYINKKQYTQLSKLKEENSRLLTSNEDYQSKIQELQNINKQLKIAGALGGNPKYRKLMKFKINHLIKEVDLCIAEISKANL